MRYTVTVFLIALILVASGCAVKTQDPVFAANMLKNGGLTFMSGATLSESASSCAVYSVRDTVRNQTLQLYCFSDEATNSSYNIVEGYSIETTITWVDASYFSCSYKITRN